MNEYVAQVVLTVNGQQIDDFVGVTEKEIEIYKEVKLMNTTGVVSTVARYGIEVEYVIPKNVPEFDFATVSDGTLTIDRGGNAGRITYTGVQTMKIGATKYDGEKEATKTIDFFASKRVAE